MSTEFRRQTAHRPSAVREIAGTRPAASEAAPIEAVAGEPPAWFVWDLALMTLVSAFLLFQVQPLISKFILPWFGGSPAVWTTCMLFFQSLLFCGYAYAHFTSQRLSPRRQIVVHLILIAAAIALLPIAPSTSWKPAAGMDPTWRILGLLTASVGLPYFVLSSTGPLGQAWFSRALARRSPYRLYALSNFGSLAALVTFPLLFEPAFTAETQSTLWSSLFIVFGVLTAGVAIWLWRHRGERAIESAGLNRKPEVRDEGASVLSKEQNASTTGRRVLWLALPALASLLLLATTNQACQNVAVVPLLWVVPLALYLLTFIVCFDHERWYRRGPYSAIAAVLLFLSAGGADWLSDVIPALVPSIDAKSFTLSFIQERILYFATMVMVCMVCHGELVRLRPAARHLTEYYLMIAAGGALGGALVSIIAPRVFPGYWEWNIALVVSIAVVGFYWLRSVGFQFESRATVATAQPTNVARRSIALPIARAVGAFGLAAVLIVIIAWQLEALTPSADNIHQRRNFYGVVKVYDYADERGQFRLFKNGGVSHGRQWVSDDPAKRHEATAYYAPETGAGRAIRFFQHKPDMRVGVVGLGVGTLASYATKPEHTIKFYEINPEVVSIAKTFFRYLCDCRGRAEIALGDARLTLEAEPPQNFDVLVLDAFSGDAPPAHLLTREAFAVYHRHLKPDGIIAVNIKNRYVRLAPVVKAAADAEGFRTTRIWTDEDKDRLLYEVDYMLLTNNDEFLKANPPILAPGDSGRFEPILWTDHFNNLLRLLMR
jgi:hypothetical protein